MLKIYDPSNVSNVIPFPIEDDMRYVTHKYSGYDTLTFEMANNDPLYKYVVEETKIEDEKNRYIVKKVDEHSDFVTVVCYVDLDDWKVNVFEEFRTTNKILSEVLALLLPDGWTVIGAGQFSKRTTVEEMEGQPFKGANPVDILPAVAEAYSCTFQFNAINKTIEAIDPTTFRPSGYFFTDELNLKNLGFVGDSTSFATRLYAFGKKDEDGNALTFASINDGKPYVEDHSYSDKVISVGWSDERYINKENLLADAKAKLQELAYPIRSYTCDADKLGDGTWLYQIVTLIDRRRKTRVNHQVVEYKEYPNHVGDSVTLSMVAPRIESYVGKVESDLKNQIKNESYTIQQELNKAIEYATQQITGNKGGHFMWVFDGQGRPIELLNLGDTDDINTAKQVWRWNASGLGHSNDGYNGAYTLALLSDGSINASAITAGTMSANLIRTGAISGANGKVLIDLENNTLNLNGQVTANGNFTINEDGTIEAIGGKVGGIGIYDEYMRHGKNVHATNWLSMCTPHDITIAGKYGDVYMGQGGLATSGWNTDTGGTGGMVFSTQIYWGTVRLKVGDYVVGGLQAAHGSLGDNTYGGLGMTLCGVDGNAIAYLNRSQATFTGDVFVEGGFEVNGVKNRRVKTEDFGNRLLYCYEMPSPMFGDVGEATVGDDGLVYIELDPVFEQTIVTEQYQVFIQKYGSGDVYVKERKTNYFIVEGTPGLSFGWEVKCKQKDFDQLRLEQKFDSVNNESCDYGAMAGEAIADAHTDYGEAGADYVQQIQEGILI